MIAFNLKEEVVFVQNLFLSNLDKKINDFKFKKYQPTGIFAEVLKKPISDVEDYLGNFGSQLRYVAQYFDFSHPCFRSLVNLFAESEVVDKIKDSFVAYDAAKESNDFIAIDSLKSFINESYFAKELDLWSNKFLPIRVIKDKDLRQEMRRNTKLNRNCCGVSFYEFEIHSMDWVQSPDSLSNCVRGSEYDFEKDLEHCSNLVSRFSELGLVYQENVFRGYRDNIASSDNFYCGFRKLDMSFIAGTASKIHGFMPGQNSLSLSLLLNDDLMEFLCKHLCLSPEKLEEIADCVEKTWTSNHPYTVCDMLNSKDWKDVVKSYTKECPLFNFCARIYPVFNPVVEKIVPEEIFNIIDNLDNFHDYGNLPLFDNYFLVVPSISIDRNFYNNDSKRYFVKDEEMLLKSFGTNQDVEIFLDFSLMKQKMVNPILVGQKDDFKYPICYCNWS